jgi:hypothetical protein
MHVSLERYTCKIFFYLILSSSEVHTWSPDSYPKSVYNIKSISLRYLKELVTYVSNKIPVFSG